MFRCYVVYEKDIGCWDRVIEGNKFSYGVIVIVLLFICKIF